MNDVTLELINERAARLRAEASEYRLVARLKCARKATRKARKSR